MSPREREEIAAVFAEVRARYFGTHGVGALNEIERELAPILKAAPAQTGAHSPAPWDMGEIEEGLGYDCMTHGIRIGPVVLDGRDYGQKSCAPLPDDVRVRMLADARIIAEALNLAHLLARAVEHLAVLCEGESDDPSVGITGWDDCHQVVAEAREVLACIGETAPIDSPSRAEIIDALHDAERIAWQEGSYIEDGVRTIRDDSRGDLWRKLTGILERIESPQPEKGGGMEAG